MYARMIKSDLHREMHLFMATLLSDDSQLFLLDELTECLTVPR